MQIIITSVLMITLWLSTFQLIPNERKEFKPTIPCDDDDKCAAGINYLGLEKKYEASLSLNLTSQLNQESGLFGRVFSIYMESTLISPIHSEGRHVN